MSGSSRRRHSKWDHRDSEALSENFFEKDPPRKTREPPSPSRGLRRHESHRRERIMQSDREDDNIRPSPGPDERRYRHQSRSPRNGWGRSYRSRSRSRSRSQSPAYNYRREPALTERSRGKSGGSATICKDFIAGRCRRGSHCFFLHQDAEFNDNKRPLGSSPPDSWENKDRKNGSSRYPADESKDYSVRSERSGNLCNDFLKGRCRRGSSCRFTHHEGPMADTFEKGPADVYKDRDSNRRIQDNYPDRNHDRETYRRVATPCRFFAVGNCRNGNHCKFSHQVKENFSPERWSRDDRRGSDRKLDRSPASDEPRWGDAIRVSNVPAAHDWEEDKETLAVNSVKPGDDSWDHGMVEMKQTWDAPSGTDEPKIGDERQTLPWKTENSGAPIGVDNISGDMAVSLRDASKQQNSSLYSETPSLSNISFLTVQPDTSETRDKHYHYDFPEPKASSDAYAGENPNFEDKLNAYTEEGKNNVGSERMCVTSNPPINVQPIPGMFQNDPHVNVRPTGQLQLPLRPSGVDTMQLSPLSPSMNAPAGRGISPGDPRIKFRTTPSMNPPAGQVQLLLPLHSSGGNGIQTSHNHSSFFDNNKAADAPPVDQSVNLQPSSINPSVAQGQLLLPLHSPGGNGIQTSHNPTAFLNNKAFDEPHSGNANVMQPVSNHSTVSNEQLAQLSHLSISLAQLLESRQQLNLSSASNPSGIPSLPDTASSILSVSNTIQPSQAPGAVNQDDPICDIIEQKMPKSSNQMLPTIVELKSLNNEPCFENINVNQRELSKDGENGGKLAEGESKAPENKLSENIAADEDGKKSRDTKGLRSFKFALADYTKELLKPAWKDGKVNKENYKTIVKKVVDKVIETQGPQIPQTKEKIDQYLSCSKTKLEKLVQAYVGKYKT